MCFAIYDELGSGGICIEIIMNRKATLVLNSFDDITIKAGDSGPSSNIISDDNYANAIVVVIVGKLLRLMHQ